MAKKSILFIITKSVWGGAGKYVYDLATNLPPDFAVAAAAGGKGELFSRLNQADIPYFEIKSFQRQVNIFKDVFAFWEILRLFFRLKPDIVHINSSKAGAVAGLAAKIYQILAFRNLRLIFTAHGWAFNEERSQWQIFLIKIFSKITALFYGKIICVSEFDRKTALKNKIASAKKLITIRNGIDLKKLNLLSKAEAQKKLIGRETQAGEKIIGTIAEWTKNKGIIYLLEALRREIAAPSPKLGLAMTSIILIGSGENPDKEKIINFIKKNNLKNVLLREFIPNAASYLKAFDFFILPSIKEGLPYTIMEAMAAGLPVIASKVGGIPELIDNNINGILIEPKKSDLIAEEIVKLLEQPAVAKRLAKKAEQKAKQEFGLERMIEKTKELYLCHSEP